MKNRKNELKILELISQGRKDISQRDISRIVGMSLGMTNSILKRFAEKGYIIIKKVNNRNIHYVLTSDGIDELGQRSWLYFKRTIKNVVVYRKAINKLAENAKKEGYSGICLIGISDLAFIVEHECYKLQIPFYHLIEEVFPEEDKYFIIMAENDDSPSGDDHGSRNYSLNQIVYGYDEERLDVK